MLGILLLGALLSMLLPGEGAEHKREELLVGHQIERQAMVSSPGLEVSSEVQDSAQAGVSQETTTD